MLFNLVNDILLRAPSVDIHYCINVLLTSNIVISLVDAIICNVLTRKLDYRYNSNISIWLIKLDWWLDRMKKYVCQYMNNYVQLDKLWKLLILNTHIFSYFLLDLID